MHMMAPNTVGRSLTLVAAAALFAACGDHNNPVTPKLAAATAPQLDRSHENEREGNIERAVVDTLRRVTARYHNIENAKHDGFVLLHDCETRLNDEPVGTVYVNFSRLTDGVINLEKPDALIYEPGPTGLTLVGVELAIPFQLAPHGEPPKLLGATFQREDEFGVFALHAWVWRSNPDGLFAETNPRVSCTT
jgi:hypothetical protein